MKTDQAEKAEQAQTATAEPLRAAAGSPNLRWTAEVPAADGWWWYQPHAYYPKRPIEIWSKTRGGRVIERLCNWCGQTNLDALMKAYPAALWAGPLLEPLEAWDEESSETHRICEE